MTNKTSDTDNMKISFVIISGGDRPESLKRVAESIEKQGMPDHEIIIVGKRCGEEPESSIFVDAADLAETAAICKMRNIGAERANGDIVTLMDDDVELADSWYETLESRLTKDNWDIAGCRVTGPSGERWYDWSWASRKDPSCPPRILDYGEQSDGLYISGCLMIIRRHVFEKVRFNENLLNHQRDDVDFCHRALDAGFTFTCWPEAYAIHHLEPAGRCVDDPASGEDAFVAQAIFLFRKGEYENALSLFREQPQSTKVVYHSALTLKALGNNEESLRLFNRVLTDADKKIAEERRYYYTSCFHMAVLKEKEEDTEMAVKFYNEALDGFPEHKAAALGLDRVARSGAKP